MTTAILTILVWACIIAAPVLLAVAVMAARAPIRPAEPRLDRPVAPRQDDPGLLAAQEWAIASEARRLSRDDLRDDRILAVVEAWRAER